jgi:hypothetical protein
LSHPSSSSPSSTTPDTEGGGNVTSAATSSEVEEEPPPPPIAARPERTKSIVSTRIIVILPVKIATKEVRIMYFVFALTLSYEGKLIENSRSAKN